MAATFIEVVEPHGTEVRGAPVINDLGGGFKYFLFSPLPGEMIQFDF